MMISSKQLSCEKKPDLEAHQLSLIEPKSLLFHLAESSKKPAANQTRLEPGLCVFSGLASLPEKVWAKKWHAMFQGFPLS